MSTTVTGDLPTTKVPPAPTGQTAVRKNARKQIAKSPRGARTTIVSTAPRTAPMKRASPRTATRTAPAGVAANGKATDLLAGFIQSMPTAGTQMAEKTREACKATFGALLDWTYPSGKAA